MEVMGQITGVCFTHVAHRSAVYYLFTAYTERAFLQLVRLFKHPLIANIYSGKKNNGI